MMEKGEISNSQVDQDDHIYNNLNKQSTTTMSVHSLPNLTEKETTKGNGDSRRSDPKPRLKTLFDQEFKDLCSVSLWRAAFAEFVGTGLLCVFTIGFGLVPEHGHHPPILQIAIGVGFFIALIITTFLSISGGHVNPCISIAFFLSGHITFVRFIIYSLFQVMGAVTGSGLLKAMSPSGHIGSLGLILPNSEVTDGQAVIAEMMITFFLIFVTLAMIDPGRPDAFAVSNIPFMVGLTVTVNILFAYTTSGGCMNPARNIGPAIVTGNWTKQWIYWLGPLSGAVIGAVVYEIVFSAKKLDSKRWCNPAHYDHLSKGDNDDDEHNETNNNDSNATWREDVPLRDNIANNNYIGLLHARETHIDSTWE